MGLRPTNSDEKVGSLSRAEALPPHVHRRGEVSLSQGAEKGAFVTLPHGRGSVSALESAVVSEPRP
jgi:hypothetical protein